MFYQIRDKLSAGIADAWELTETAETRWEFYFIGHRLDQNRSVKTREIGVKLYRKSADGASIGSAYDVIPPTATEADIDAVLSRLAGQAGLTQNAFYRLAEEPLSDLPAEEAPDVPAIAESYIRAFQAIPETEAKRLNSYEIFTSEVTRHTLNSNGVEATCTWPSSELEVIVNASDEDHEVELYRIYKSGTCDPEALVRDVTRVMGFGSDRLRAVPTPRLGTADILLSTSDAVQVYQYFADRMSADYVYRKMSDWQIGQPVAKAAAGDRITLEAVRYLPNSSTNYPVDAEGRRITDRFLIRDGIAEHYFGSRQFSEYLGVNPSSAVTNFRVSGGSRTEAELRAADYLEVVEFSSFDVDSMSGDIAGEIRLGYWHHDGVTEIVTGGSVSGSMGEAAGAMRFSKETMQYNNREIPAVTILPGLRVTGV